jgi:hypothetical protein
MYLLVAIAYFIWSCHVHHSNISLLLHSLDPGNEELELEVQAEDTNPETEQRNPGDHTIILDFYFKFNIFILRMIVH